jgi:hypothetical protein
MTTNPTAPKCGHCNGLGDIDDGDHLCFACGGSGKTPTPPNGGAALEENVAADWRKLDLWFFRDCSESTRRQLFALFGLPILEIRNQGMERIALKHIRNRLAPKA